MTNRITLEQASEMEADDVSKLPIDQLALLLSDVADLKAQTKAIDDHIHMALRMRFDEAAADLRRAKGSDTGTVRIVEGDHVAVHDLPKKPEWDQRGLADVANSLVAMGEQVEEYMTIKREVSERAYGAWPASLRKLFEPHRTLKVGKPTIKIEARKD